MALNKEYKKLLLLFGAGLLCLLYGLGVSYIESHFSTATMTVSFIGLVCIGVCIVTLRRLTRQSIKTSLWKSYALVTMMIVLLGILLVAVNYVASTYNWRWDVTKANQHTLSKSTNRFIRGLTTDIRLTAFHVGLPPKYLEDLFREYARLSDGKIITEIIDPLVKIGYAAQFGKVISGKEKKVIVHSGGDRRDIDFTKSPLSEEQLTNAIIRVARESRTVYFLTGHGEYDLSDDADNGFSALNKYLSATNVVSKKLMLGIEGKIPDDCDVLIIAGPKNHLTEKEEKIIGEYLEQGGDALFLIEHTLVTTPDKPLTEEEKRKNPSLNSILNEWGIRIADDIVVDLASHASGDVGSPATRNYMAHRAIVEGLDYTFYIRPRSISIKGNRRKTLKVAPLVLTASDKGSWGETDRMLQVKFDEMLDRAGPVPIAFTIWEPKEKDEASDTRIIVFTDADFLSNAYIDQYSNAEMGLNVINWLSELDYQVFIDRKNIKVERLDLTSKQKRTVVVVLFMMPLLIATSGIMVWMRQQQVS